MKEVLHVNILCHSKCVVWCGVYITHTDINMSCVSILGRENRAEFSKSGNLVGATV